MLVRFSVALVLIHKSSLGLFLGLFEDYVFAELGGVFLVLDLALNKLFVLASPIDLTGLFVLELYE